MSRITPRFLQRVICYIPFRVTDDEYGVLETKVKRFLSKNPKHLKSHPAVIANQYALYLKKR